MGQGAIRWGRKPHLSNPSGDPPPREFPEFTFHAYTTVGNPIGDEWRAHLDGPGFIGLRCRRHRGQVWYRFHLVACPAKHTPWLTPEQAGAWWIATKLSGIQEWSP